MAEFSPHERVTAKPIAPRLEPIPSEPLENPKIARHWLGVAEDVTPQELLVLAAARFTSAAWLRPAHISGAGDEMRWNPGKLQLSRYTTIRGPYAPIRDGKAVHIGPRVAMVYEIYCPKERVGPSAPVGGDRDGLLRVFGQYAPVREEARVAPWLVAAARRLSGTVLFGIDDDQINGTVTPDASACVDMTIHSTVWLDPHAALQVCRNAEPSAFSGMQPLQWAGPAKHAGGGSDLDNNALSGEALFQLHRAADEFDAQSLQAPIALDAYSINVDLGFDGMVSVEVQGQDEVPPPLRYVSWAQDGTITYTISWAPEDLEELGKERPSIEYRAARKHAAGVVLKLMHELHVAVGGMIVDQDEFLIDPREL